MGLIGEEFEQYYKESSKYTWEFSQMFGEDESDSDFSESGYDEG